MPYIAPEVVQEVKRMDLLTYLKNYEPYELVHFSGNTYTTKSHDSLKISNGRWMWWSRGVGGRSALDYLIKVRDYSFMEAVELIAGQAAIQPPAALPAEKTKEKKLLLPKANRYLTNVVSYLKGRGIDTELIDFCIRTGRVYESEYHHNAVFVGMDQAGKPKYAALRGIGTDFIGEASGSDKNYSFSIPADSRCSTVHLFESAIDLLSYATLEKMEGQKWQAQHLLSLAGVYQPAKEIENNDALCIRLGIRQTNRGEKTIKITHQAGQAIKSSGKGTIKVSGRTVKTAERTARTTFKTTEQTAKATQDGEIIQNWDIALHFLWIECVLQSSQ